MEQPTDDEIPMPDLYRTPSPPPAADEDWELNQEPWQSRKEEPRKKAPKAKPQTAPTYSDPEFASPLSPDWARAHTAQPGQRKVNKNFGASILNLSHLRASPKFSFKVSKDRFTNLKLAAASQVPGPGAYSTTSKLSEQASNSKHRRSPGYGFGSAGRQSTPRNQPPGPGAYAGAAVSYIGKGRSTSVTPRRNPPENCKNNGALISPGPGTHHVPAILGNEGPKHTISDRRTTKENVIKEPGPGQYGRCDHTINLTKLKEPSYRFGTSQREGAQTERGDRPVPGMKGRSSAHAHDSKLPGPGSYEFPGIVGEGPKHSFGAKRPEPRPTPSPGPGDTFGTFTTFA